QIRTGVSCRSNLFAGPEFVSSGSPRLHDERFEVRRAADSCAAFWAEPATADRRVESVAGDSAELEVRCGHRPTSASESAAQFPKRISAEITVLTGHGHGLEQSGSSDSVCGPSDSLAWRLAAVPDAPVHAHSVHRPEFSLPGCRVSALGDGI